MFATTAAACVCVAAAAVVDAVVDDAAAVFATLLAFASDSYAMLLPVPHYLLMIAHGTGDATFDAAGMMRRKCLELKGFDRLHLNRLA